MSKSTNLKKNIIRLGLAKKLSVSNRDLLFKLVRAYRMRFNTGHLSQEIREKEGREPTMNDVLIQTICSQKLEDLILRGSANALPHSAVAPSPELGQAGFDKLCELVDELRKTP
jgi:hypothetical protein